MQAYLVLLLQFLCHMYEFVICIHRQPKIIPDKLLPR